MSGTPLPPEVQAAVLACLPLNEQAVTGRLVSPDACRRLSNRTARFRLPLPPSAGDPAWQPHLSQARKQLTFKSKFGMLSAAAASGSEVNLELAWGLLRPCLFPELLHRPQGYRAMAFYDYIIGGADPGTAAVQAGHAAAVLPWLVRHGCPLHPEKTLEAVAQHCDLAGLQAAWELLGFGASAAQDDAAEAKRFCALARAAGLSGGGLAIAKLTWLCAVVPAAVMSRYRLQLLAAAAVGAAAAGCLPVLHWLRDQGLDLPSTRASDAKGIWLLGAGEVPLWATVLATTLQGGHVAVADWLVDEAGCPQPSEEAWGTAVHVWLAAAGGGHVESLRWLLGRGLPAYELFVLQAAGAGHLEAARFLHQECGDLDMTEKMFVEAAGTRSLPTVQWLVQVGCPMDPEAYLSAASVGDADMVEWLAKEAACPWDEGTPALVISRWARRSAADRGGLPRALRALEDAGCPPLEEGGYHVTDALDAAAARGDLWLLRRLHEELGLGLRPWTVAEAAEGGCEAVLEWLVGFVGQAGLGADPPVKAGGNGDRGTLECLQRLGVGFNSRVVRHAARNGVPLPVLRWLVEQGAPWDERAAAAVEKAACAAKRDGQYGDSLAWVEARLGREVRMAERDSDSSWQAVRGGGWGDGSEEESEDWGVGESWQQASTPLPPELQAAVLAFLPPNEQAVTGRLVSPDACRRLSNRTARFGLPLPPAAGDPAWQPHLHQAFKKLTFKQKLSVLSAAAASGSEINLELAWGLLRPCLFPELLHRPQGYRAMAFYDFKIGGPDPGTAAVRAGHAEAVLPWLVRHGCPLHPDKTLEAVAQHCDLAGLQAAWELLGFGSSAAQDNAAEAKLYCALARAAGQSGGALAIAKLTWMCAVAPAALLSGDRLRLLEAAAVGAAAAGALPMLAWLRDQGLDLPSTHNSGAGAMVLLEAGEVPPWAEVLAAALRGGHVAVADWLVVEAGCPQPSEAAWGTAAHVWVAAAEGGHVESLRWLLGYGLTVYKLFVLHAASAGQLEAARFLHQDCGRGMTGKMFVEAAGSRSVPTVQWLLQAGCPMDPQAYLSAASVGDADMVEWLAKEAACPWDEGTPALVISRWARRSAADRGGLPRALRALEDAGCPPLEEGGYHVTDALDAAAARGDLWLLRRLHEELGLGLRPWTVAEAAEGGCEAVLEWLVGFVGQAGLGADPPVKAGGNGDRGTLECLQRLGVGFNSRVVRHAARNGVPLPVLRWLVEQGAPWDERAAAAVEKAARVAKRDGQYGDSVAWVEARLGREVRRAGRGKRFNSRQAVKVRGLEFGSGEDSEDWGVSESWQEASSEDSEDRGRWY